MKNVDKFLKKLKQDKALAKEFNNYYRQGKTDEIEKMAKREGCPCSFNDLKRAYFDKLSDSELKGSFEQSAQGAQNCRCDYIDFEEKKLHDGTREPDED